MKIRTRAFIGLWLIYLLAAVAIGLIAYSFTATSRFDAERTRISEVLNLHGTMWRALVEARRRVEAAHADLLATVETVPAALMIFNTDGSVRLRNRAATDVFGIEPQNPELRHSYWTRFKRIAKDGSLIPPDKWISSRARWSPSRTFRGCAKWTA